MSDPITNVLKMLFGNLTKTGVDYGMPGDISQQPGAINEDWGGKQQGNQRYFDDPSQAGVALAQAMRPMAHPQTSEISGDLSAAIELGTNRERIGGSKEIYKSSDFSTPGKVFPNAGLDKLALHAVSRLLPQLGRVNQATDVTSGKTDLPQLAGGNLGVYNYPVTSESRLRKKMAIASDYSQSKSAVLKQNPQTVKDLFANDPDAAVYIAFRPHMQQTLGQLKKIDQAKEMISSSSEAPDRKKAALAALDKAREQEVANADKVDRAVDMVLKRVHEQRGTGLTNLPIFRLLRGQMVNQTTTP